MGLALVPPPEAPMPPKFSYRYFERFDDQNLTRIQRTIAVVLDDRSRQFSLFDEAPPLAADPQHADAADYANAGALLEAAPARGARTSDLGDLLSPSQVRGFLDCQARWWFRYGLKLPDLRSGSLALGSAVHKTAEHYYRRKLAHEPVPELGEIAEIFGQCWRAQIDGIDGPITLNEKETADDLERAGGLLAEKYLTEVAPSIEPAAVEERVSGEIAGVNVQGYVDLIDTDGRIIDLKTAKQTPSGVDPAYAFQLATYRQLHPKANGQARLDTLVRLKTPKLVTTEYAVTIADQMMTQKLYPAVQDAMQGGLYLPNRGSHMCSRRNCAYAEACEREFGGHVDE